MSLDAEKERTLANAGLCELYEEHRELWFSHALTAHQFIKPWVEQINLPVRRDDVVKNMLSPLRLDTVLQTFLERRKLRQKYWTLWFAELIVEREWQSLTRGHSDGSTMGPGDPCA